MKVVDRIEAQEEKLTEEQKDNLFTKMVMGKDVTEEIETSRGKFTVKFPRPADLITIGKIAAVRRGNRAVESFDEGTDMLITMTSTLDVLVVDNPGANPKWYENARKKENGFTFMDVPSRAFLSELYGKVYSFREKVESRFDKAEGTNDKPVSPAKGADGAVGDGVLEGLSGEFGRTQ
jgi:hypothetical protein